MRALRPALVTALVLVSAGARAESIVQVSCDGVLDGRPVSTLTGGVIVPWTAGIDKDDAYMTTAAAASLHQTGPALPDDGRFAASAEHPEVVLHFSNAAPAASPQAHLQTAMGAFSVPVPAATYSSVLLFLTASYGDAALAIKMTYADQTTTMTTFTLPDWGTGKAPPTTPPIFFNLIAGLHKWNKAGASLDTPSHTITGVVLTPASERKLTAVEIAKTTAAPWLTFWGATGVATGPVGGGVDAGEAGVADAAAEKPLPVEAGPPGADAAAGTGGAAGVGGAGGSGAAGTNGAAGTIGAAGVGGAAGTIGAAGAGAPPPSRSSGGCAVSPPGRADVVGLLLLVPLVVSARRRRRRR